MSGIALVLNTKIHFNVYIGDYIAYIMLPFFSLFIFYHKQIGAMRTHIKNVTVMLCLDNSSEFGIKHIDGAMLINFWRFGLYIIRDINIKVEI